MSVRWLLVLLVAVGAPQVAHGQDELFQQGNQFYQAEDWSEAISAYENLLAAGFEGADLYYNLGNAYFKKGELGRSILNWERAAAIQPGEPDLRANLDLAGSLTIDVIEPLPEFWLLGVWSWWLHLIPYTALVLFVGGSWLLLAGGSITRILGRSDGSSRWGTRAASVGAVVLVLAGANLVVRELGLGQADRGVILLEAVQVRSAPSEDEDLTLFEIHEGTRVRIDQRAGLWAEIVLEDGKVGWVPVEAMEVI
ncbi:MAG: tetratricopeptide repeat protein [Gemmatimonadales bacterium]|jgi:tetratricopeptide (TPR) repeat protein|nr:tetratricopeptide repeat protein [Gemmatimonadales bacterium]MBT3499629.1 tetratricopeptide repeat protein [Gemmatimonadales bacterium]MBT4913747.1 tetratricopeptide repeat protein [Gemmatimonadales bacterium]MBT5046850.1 tetratricopeptide repeat protein [Gemmatimonadales bacterium]MBT5695425.1 tetratricopeptide repeat protein [Gemmatimonadales bacterium]